MAWKNVASFFHQNKNISPLNGSTKLVDQSRKDLPRGSFISVRGQVNTMHDSYTAFWGSVFRHFPWYFPGEFPSG
jgi:hypothetical protein